ncbi:hypothetical protein [Pandoraea apista]|uniref:DUF4189 domain-containing protein n=1 Tax=Pandoraea apista TaxID=93218 RepID=A0A5E5P0S0_9BURK|nr:hypothetical protein [Pandoraea apista]VVG69369.1 hypothetical protein PAP18089_00322 [Pandoraea apista]
MRISKLLPSPRTRGWHEIARYVAIVIAFGTTSLSANAEFYAWRVGTTSYRTGTAQMEYQVVWSVGQNRDQAIQNLNKTTWIGPPVARVGGGQTLDELTKCQTAGYFAVILTSQAPAGACGKSSRAAAYKAALKSCQSKADCTFTASPNLQIISGFDSGKYAGPNLAPNQQMSFRYLGERVEECGFSFMTGRNDQCRDTTSGSAVVTPFDPQSFLAKYK